MTRAGNPRKLARVIDACLPFLGVAVTLGAVVFVRESYDTQIALVGLGMVLIQLGVWKTAHRLVLDQRECLALRAEGARFLDLMRELNAAALVVKRDDTPENREVFDQTSRSMRESVERMIAVAGVTTEEPASEERPGGAMRDPRPVGASTGAPSS